MEDRFYIPTDAKLFHPQRKSRMVSNFYTPNDSVINIENAYRITFTIFKIGNVDLSPLYPGNVLKHQSVGAACFINGFPIADAINFTNEAPNFPTVRTGNATANSLTLEAAPGSLLEASYTLRWILDTLTPIEESGRLYMMALCID